MLLPDMLVDQFTSTAALRNDSLLATGKYHLVQVELHEQDILLLAGVRGTAKIEARRSTLAATISRSLKQTLRLPW